MADHETGVQFVERHYGAQYLAKHPELKAGFEALDAEYARREALTPEERKAEDDAKEEAIVKECERLSPLFIQAMIAEELEIGEAPDELCESDVLGLDRMFPEIRDDSIVYALYQLMGKLLREAKMKWESPKTSD